MELHTVAKIKNHWLESVPANTLKGNDLAIQNSVKDLTTSEVVNMLDVVTEAPINDNSYVRKNASWSQLDGTTSISEILTPEILSPIDESINTELTPTIQFSNYYSLYGKPQKALQIIISTDSSFITTIYDTTIENSISQWEIPSDLDALTQYWVKGRYQDIDDTWSEYSDSISFTTSESTYIDVPNILSPSNGSINQLLTLTITASNFNCVNGSDTHESSDWEIYSNSSLTNLVWSSIDDTVNLESITIPSSILDTDTIYYVRVRYTGITYGNSSYSIIVSFTTGYIVQPSIITPLNGSTGIPTNSNLVGNSFDSTDTHDKTDWEVATDTNFNNIIFSSYDDTSNLESITMSSLISNTQYYARLRYYGNLFGWSDWSGTISFTTANAYIQTPTNQSPADSSIDIGETPTLTTSNFNCINGSDTHESSDWEIYDDVSLSNLIFSSYDDTSNLESIFISSGNLSADTTYYFRCRHTGVTYGDSEWSTSTNFTTKTTFCEAHDGTLNEGPGPSCAIMNYDSTTDTGFYGYVGCGNESDYNSSTTYSTGNIVNNGSNHFYYSKTDSNLDNSLPAIGGENTNWKWIGNGILTDGVALRTDIGLVSGTTFNNSYGWLKFFIGSTADCNDRHGTVTAQDRVIFVSMKTLRYNLSWEDIYNVGAIYGTNNNGTNPPGSGMSGKVTQDTQVTYSGNTYIVRVLTGSENDPADEEYDNQQCVDDTGNGSEWNDLIYRIHEDSPTCSDVSIGQYNSTTTRHGGPQDDSNWMDFTNTDLQIYNTVSGDGTGSFCQEQGDNTNRRVYRGEYGVADFYTAPESIELTTYGWRPVLELIQS